MERIFSKFAMLHNVTLCNSATSLWRCKISNNYNILWNFLLFQCFCAMTLFYCAHWQTYVSGTLRFGKVDVTEAQYSIISIQLISAIFGPGVWSTKVRERFLALWISIHIINHSKLTHFNHSIANVSSSPYPKRSIWCKFCPSFLEGHSLCGTWYR